MMMPKPRAQEEVFPHLPICGTAFTRKANDGLIIPNAGFLSSSLLRVDMAFIKRCAYCQETIVVLPYQIKRKKYCSKDCQNKDKIGKSVSPATEFKKGNRPQTYVPVGSTSMSKGYLRVKVAEPNIWRQNSHIVWERANKKKLPEGWIVRHLDNDSLNDEPGNLKAMPRSKHILETLKDPMIEKHTREQVSRGNKRRWKIYREKKMQQYDTYYWQLEIL